MLRTNFLTILSLSLVSLSITGCASVKELYVKDQPVERKIPIQERPRGVKLNKVEFFVVNEENIEEFLENFEKKNGVRVFFALSVRDYEKLSLNISDIKRYVEQQNEVIVYYENMIQEK